MKINLHQKMRDARKMLLLSLSKRALLPVMFLFLLISNGSAQNFSIVGTGNGNNCGTCYPAPFGNYFWGSKNQMFITAAELVNAGIQAGGLINSVGVNVQAVNSAPIHVNFTVRIMTTNSADPLVSGYINANLVASSTPTNVQPVLGWMHFSFPQFTWNGTDNIVVETCYNNSSWISNGNASTEWQTNLTGTAVKTRYNYQDNGTACSFAANGEITTTNTRPLVRFEWLAGIPCSGTPGANSVLTPTGAICPNSATMLGLTNTYTVGGMSFQWQYSNLSAVGPWTTIPSATLSTIMTPSLPTTSYFSAIITCTNSTGSVTATSGTVMVSATTTNSVPYYEDFEGIGSNNKLPNCSWQASNIPGTCQTYTNVQNQTRIANSGNSFAAFGPYNTATNQNYFFSNGIWMEAGVTYSASMWYITDYYGYNTWNLNMLIGPGQTPTGATVIASESPATSPAYKSLSNTFTVPSSGFYYVGINAISNAACCAYYLSWDDLRIEAPCQLNPVPLTVSALNQTICTGSAANLNASGADTYTWSNGANGANITVTPNSSLTYTVVGMNAASGCTAAAMQYITVNETPIVAAFASKAEICTGESTNLVAMGTSASYAWSNNAAGSNISVSPTANTSYTVVATSTNNCSAEAVVSVTVNPLPPVSVSSSNSTSIACIEDVTTLSGVGAVSYQWSSPLGMMIGAQVNVSPAVSTSYTLVGTDAKGCNGTSVYNLSVVECVGLRDVSTTANGIKLYPNPSNGEFVVELNSNKSHTIEVSDLTGRILISTTSSLHKNAIDLSQFANGVYYVKIVSDVNPEVIKVVKQ